MNLKVKYDDECNFSNGLILFFFITSSFGVFVIIYIIFLSLYEWLKKGGTAAPVIEPGDVETELLDVMRVVPVICFGYQVSNLPVILKIISINFLFYYFLVSHFMGANIFLYERRSVIEKISIYNLRINDFLCYCIYICCSIWSISIW